MNVTNLRTFLSDFREVICATIDGADYLDVPPIEGNRHYAAILAAIEAGDIDDWRSAKTVYVDADGYRWLRSGDGRQSLKVGHDQKIVREGGQWRTVTEADELGVARQRARVAVVAEADRISADLTAQYSASEMSAWSAKAAEARDVLAGGDPDSAFLLGIEATLRRITVPELAQMVVERAPLTLAIPAAVAGLRARTEAEIEGAADQQAIDAILVSARTRAQDMARAVAADDMAAFREAMTRP